MSNTVVIRSGMNPDLVLGVTNGNVVLQWIDLSNTSQQWNRIDHGPTFSLVNVGTSTGMAVDGNNHIVVSGAGVQWNVGGSDTFQAIRLATNFDLNVNSPGGSMNIGQQLIVYGWSGGASNELWYVENYSDIQPFATSTVEVIGGGGGSTVLMYSGGEYWVEGQGTPTQNPQYLFKMVQWTWGFSLQNQASGEYLMYCGDDAWVCQSAGMCVNSLWTNGAISPNSFRAIRPWLNSNMNLNVFGADYPKPGSHVGVYSWSGGNNNEVWSFATMSSNPQTAARNHPAHKGREAVKA